MYFFACLQIVYESAICNGYLEEQYPEPALFPRDPYLRAQARITMDGYNKVHDSG